MCASRERQTHTLHQSCILKKCNFCAPRRQSSHIYTCTSNKSDCGHRRAGSDACNAPHMYISRHVHMYTCTMYLVLCTMYLYIVRGTMYFTQRAHTSPPRLCLWLFCVSLCACVCVYMCVRARMQVLRPLRQRLSCVLCHVALHDDVHSTR